jgi:SET domain-containing protein
MESYISPKAKKGLPSNIHKLGIFAVEDINKNEIIAIKKGSYLTRKEMEKLGIEFGFGIQVDDDLFIAHKDKQELKKNFVYINHSCNPNCGMKGNNGKVLSMRDIKNDEELTIDYAMFMNDDSSMQCSCKSDKCRKIITGKDWKKIELQEKYNGYFTDYIQNKIKRLK